MLGYGLHAAPSWVFLTAALAIIPLAEWVRRATEAVAEQLGPAIGGLLNVSFGNAPELILALFVLRAGEGEVVKAQITGSIIGNSLLGLGLAIVVGSWGREKQTFRRERASLLGSLLMLSVVALLLPAIFDYTERGLSADRSTTAALDERLSLGVAVVLIFVYFANLAYTLVTHRDIFAAAPEDAADAAKHASEDGCNRWSMKKSLGILAGATALTAVEAELVSGALESTAHQLGLSTFFLGVTVLAVVGNAAEYVSALYFARKNRMGLVMTITVGSTIQIALLVAPLLVIASWLLGKPMNLVFSNPIELAAIASVAFVVNAIASDGETTWFEGVLLLAVYVLLALCFFFIKT
ncbi:MAG: calcium/proton exchanger [Verrucomicrobia bacterium]|nr:calcium/proton exchanger [Verrucomicrobiota bacterium]